MPTPTILFAGSFLGYSATILEALLASPDITVTQVLTTPPQPSGRDKVITPTPVHQVADRHQIPVFTPAVLDDEVLSHLTQPDVLLTAGYGKLIPSTWLSFPKTAALNLHFSLLPKYRGANPSEWALLRGETETGITLIEMSPHFDTGTMVAQSRMPITASDTRETLYEKVYTLGGETLPKMLTSYLEFKKSGQTPSATNDITFFLPPQPQPESPTPYARRLDRTAGGVAWSALKKAMDGQVASVAELAPQLQDIVTGAELQVDAVFLERAVRALVGFPGVWSLVQTAKGERRLKILSSHLEKGKLVLDRVQLEGQTPGTWSSVKTSVRE